MRMLMTVAMPVETANAAANAGKLGSTVQKILEETKAEAAYFTADERGRRCGYIIVDLQEASQIPALAEPWFLAFHAEVTFRPAMTPADLAKAGPAIEKAVKTFGKSAGA